MATADTKDKPFWEKVKGDCPYNQTKCADKFCNPAGGYPRPFLSVNRQLPGPMVCACEGDTIQVLLFNGLLGSSGSITTLWSRSVKKGD